MRSNYQTVAIDSNTRRGKLCSQVLQTLRLPTIFTWTLIESRKPFTRNKYALKEVNIAGDELLHLIEALVHHTVSAAAIGISSFDLTVRDIVCSR